MIPVFLSNMPQSGILAIRLISTKAKTSFRRLGYFCDLRRVLLEKSSPNFRKQFGQNEQKVFLLEPSESSLVWNHLLDLLFGVDSIPFLLDVPENNISIGSV